MTGARRILLQEVNLLDMDITRRRQDPKSSQWLAGRGGYPRCYSRLSRHASHHPAQYEPASDRTFAKLNASAPRRPAATSLIVAGGGPSHSWT